MILYANIFMRSDSEISVAVEISNQSDRTFSAFFANQRFSHQFFHREVILERKLFIRNKKHTKIKCVLLVLLRSFELWRKVPPKADT